VVLAKVNKKVTSQNRNLPFYLN